ncbi:MAG: cyclic nucleotide-binding domain-containing protein [Verrucomicrobiota bacterium]|nr:cyclic nucleotide-binding domain-containing protein [Verrucomicrobiota bacterium]
MPLQHLNINELKLTLSEDIEKRVIKGNIYLKEKKTAQYLKLKPKMFCVLKLFDGTKTVRSIISERLLGKDRLTIEPIHQLIHEAYTGGFLYVSGEENKEGLISCKKWNIGWGACIAFTFSFIFFILGLGHIWHAKIFNYSGFFECMEIAFWFAFVLSISSILAGCVLSGFDRYVYSSGITFKNIIPYFSIDLRDTFMGGSLCEFSVMLQKFSAPFLCAFLGGLINMPGAVFASFLIILIYSFPFAYTPVNHMFNILINNISKHDEHCGIKYLIRKLYSMTFDWTNPILEDRIILLFVAYIFLWFSTFIHLTLHLLPSGKEIFAIDILTPSKTWIYYYALSILIIFLFTYIFPTTLRHISTIKRKFSGYLMKTGLRGELKKFIIDEDPPRKDEILGKITQSVLFQGLPEKKLQKLSEKVVFMSFPENIEILKEGESSSDLFIIVSGKLQITKKDNKGIFINLRKCIPGDIVGEIAFLDNGKRTATVKTIGKTGIIVIKRELLYSFFDKKDEKEKFSHSLRILTFLKRLEIFDGWSDNDLINLSHHFSMINVEPEISVIEQDSVNNKFFLIYDGLFEVIKNGKRIVTLSNGDYFGEISLLKNSHTNADVTAMKKSRCLVMEEKKFKEFLNKIFSSYISVNT